MFMANKDDGSKAKWSVEEIEWLTGKGKGNEENTWISGMIIICAR